MTTQTCDRKVVLWKSQNIPAIYTLAKKTVNKVFKRYNCGKTSITEDCEKRIRKFEDNIMKHNKRHELSNHIRNY